ncbi:transcription termination factor, mitochondrial-like [Eriocheir sinensis]|uniref:transcription termination factor, mitochondrial-like n=1 Tax=Eriocheir sinensis TaxID=95602 RepID=UPI0021C80E28|nr:transcription termination factor, mitochondrial-like [Eriocheir sinensis]
MILRRLVWWGLRGRAGAGLGRGWGCPGGLLGAQYTPVAALPVPAWGGRPGGLSGIPSLSAGGGKSPHTASLSSAAFTWSRRRRKREKDGEGEGLLSAPSSRHLSKYCESNEVGVQDDEARQVEVEGVQRGDEGGGGGGGEFFDTKYHRHNSIQKGDIGVKVNVGESVIAALDRLYHIPRPEALAMVRPEEFLLVSDTALLRTLYFLKERAVTREQLRRLPGLLLHAPDNLQRKFAKLTEPHLFHSISAGLGFCLFSERQIIHYQQLFAEEGETFPNHRNRLYYLAERLEVDVELLTAKIVKPKLLLKMEINRINHIIELLTRYGVQKQDIVADLWVFYHNAQVTESRLVQVAQAGCTRPKPWICHSSAWVFERYLARTRARSQLLGETGDLVAFLSDRLSCPAHEVTALCRRNPLLLGVHVGKLQRMIDMLYEEGFTPDDVRSCLRVLQHSEKRTRRRIREMKALGHFPFPISILYKKAVTYSNYLNRVRRKMKKEEVKRLMEQMGEEEEEEEGAGARGRREE